MIHLLKVLPVLCITSEALDQASNRWTLRITETTANQQHLHKRADKGDKWATAVTSRISSRSWKERTVRRRSLLATGQIEDWIQRILKLEQVQLPSGTMETKLRPSQRGVDTELSFLSSLAVLGLLGLLYNCLMSKPQIFVVVTNNRNPNLI